MTVYIGDLLTASAASVTGKPTPSRTWQWLKNGTAISGATSSTYTVAEADIGANLSIKQIETNIAGSDDATSLTVGPVSVFSPSALFALSEPGVWYDPSDLTTLFQDTAGTTPVTTPGQTVALALDKSKGLVLGPELVTNGDFSNGSTGWSLDTWVVSNGVATANNISNKSLSQAISLSQGRVYEISFTVSNYSSGSAILVFSSGAGQDVSTSFTGNGVKKTRLTASANRTAFVIFCSGLSNFSVDNISVKELSGNHATQSILASRPTYGVVPLGGRRNLLTFTEQFDNAAWTKTAATVTANAAVAPDGTTTADLLTVDTATSGHFINTPFSSAGIGSHVVSYYVKSNGANFVQISFGSGSSPNNAYVNFDLATPAVGTSFEATGAILSVGNGWFRIVCAVELDTASAQHSVGIVQSASATRLPSFTGDGTSGIYIWGAQLELGSTATAYQRVGSAFDVTEAGVQSLGYLSFDGVDDFLVTPTITPGIDKVQVFAGVRKLSDAAEGVLLEHSVASASNSGSFAVFAPWNATNGYSARFRGTGTVGADALQSVTFTAPITNVVTAASEIATDTMLMRINGSQTASNAVDQGTGNFLAYPLYIGRRGGTSLPFNGQLYSLIVRFGANLSTSDINRAEYYVSQQAGVSL